MNRSTTFHQDIWLEVSIWACENDLKRLRHEWVTWACQAGLLEGYPQDVLRGSVPSPYAIIKGSFVEKLRVTDGFVPTSPKDPSIQLAPALKRSWSHSLTSPKIVCAVGTCAQRSWGHILTSPKTRFKLFNKSRFHLWGVQYHMHLHPVSCSLKTVSVSQAEETSGSVINSVHTITNLKTCAGLQRVIRIWGCQRH